MSRREMLLASGGALLAASVNAANRPPGKRKSPKAGFEVCEATIPGLQAAMESGRVTALDLVEAYLERIVAYDQQGPRLKAMIRVNPGARREATARDIERRMGRVRGPLHGVPVILKDNYATSDMPTSVGSVALAGCFVGSDAFQVKKLREAGAVILGKANMDELAETVEGLSSVGGQTRNPYDPSKTSGGSSSGSGVAAAASLAAVSFGTDTGGSLRIPAAFNSLFTLRPTKGLSSMGGIFPCSHTHDTAGPLARTVVDLAMSLDATVGADPEDAATKIVAGRQLPRFAAALDKRALQGSRLGVLTSFFNDCDFETAHIVRSAVDRMTEEGATTREVSLPRDMSNPTGLFGAAVWNFEFKFDVIDYLAKIPNAPVHSMAEILERGLYGAPIEGALRGYDSMGTRDSPEYRAALARQDDIRRAVLGVFDDYELDAIVYPAVRGKPDVIGENRAALNTALSAVTGLPALVVPAGFTPDNLPIGAELLGRQFADARLVALAYAYEQAVKPRRPPFSTPGLNATGPPKPVRFKAIARGNGGVVARADFSYDPTLSTLLVALRIDASDPSQIYAAALTRGTADRVGPVIHQLTGPSVLAVREVMTLRESERSDLLAGRWYLTLYTRDQSTGNLRTVLDVSAPSSRR